MNKKNHLISCF